MDSIPEFQPDILPEGVFETNLSSVRRRFVDGINPSKTRDILYKGLKGLIEKLEAIGISGVMWVDGSFVRDKNNPADVDVVLFFSSSELVLLSDSQKIEFEKLISVQRSIMEKYHCDFYYLLINEKRNSKEKVEYWHNQWSNFTIKDKNGYPKSFGKKGFISLPVGSPVRSNLKDVIHYEKQ